MSKLHCLSFLPFLSAIDIYLHLKLDCMSENCFQRKLQVLIKSHKPSVRQKVSSEAQAQT